MNRRAVSYGISFDAPYAWYLGLNAHETLWYYLHDVGFKQVRFSAHWDMLEKERGIFDFKDFDWQVRQAEETGAKVMLAVGQKTPRWPECHIPDWARQLTRAEYEEKLFAYIQAVVDRYKTSPALEYWQVENEPFLPFGSCPSFSEKQLRDEVALVKKLDPTHPTITTDSGELGFWYKAARSGDYFGTTLYRVVWNKYMGYWRYKFIPAAFYRAKLKLIGRAPETAFVTELQAEPWIPNKTLMETPLEEQYRSMSLSQLQENVQYAHKLGFSRVYLWGAEWWFWLQKQGVGDMTEYVKTLVK